MKLKEKSIEFQLQDWGETTNGGHNYGFHITINSFKGKLPKNYKSLAFNPMYLEKS